MSLPTKGVAQCGGNGQRACCNGDGEFAPGGGACDSGLSYSPTCTDPNGCGCSGGIIPSENSQGMCYQATSCGGPGQRSCCNGDGEFAPNGLACGDGLVQIPGACGPFNAAGCVCGGTSGGNEYSSGICVQPAACGGLGQRACCVGYLEYSNNQSGCNSGLVEVPGCSGDCTCGGSTSLGEPDGNSCTTIESIAEPPTNATPTTNESGLTGTWTLPQQPLPTGPECPLVGLCGYADLHVHMFASRAHGGATLAGEAWDANGVNAALAEDYGSNLSLVDQHGNAKPIVDGSAGVPECPSYLLSDSNGNNLCSGQDLFHGDHTALDSVTGGGTNDGANSNLGVPLFNGWPLWTSTVHQQVYYKWLERAWLGGLRLIVLDAVTNETLCKSGTTISGTNCADSMSTINVELTDAQNFQTWLDTQYGGPGKGWFQIVTSPVQATSVIQQGKLAVVLGIEVDNLFNCHVQGPQGPVNGEGPTCTTSYVQQQLQTYYGLGVRHIFPIHNFDNAYGTPAAWQDAINVGNYVAEGGWWAAVNCADPGYGFALSGFSEGALLLLGFGENSAPAYPSFPSGSCHDTPGLTTLGAYLVQQAMNMGMIIDVDHMSINAFNDTINLANQQQPVYAGIAATHVQFFDLYNQNYHGTGTGRHERMRTLLQLQSIADAGGMVAAMLKDDSQDTANGWCLPQGNCSVGASSLPTTSFTFNYDGPNAPSNDGGALYQGCSYSTTEWAQSYLYGVQAMRNRPVAMGSDFNGIAGHVGPRFGNGACAGSAQERALQEHAQNRLAYPFTIPGFGTFGQQVSGQKTFDFNVDGLAHIGLLPDMVADLINVGVTNQQLQPLFGSAQAYLNMWSAVAPKSPPNVSLSGVPATAAYRSTFTVSTNNNGTTTSIPTIAAGPSTVCAINGAVVGMLSGTGTCLVTATWAPDAHYAGTSISQGAVASKIAPHVNFFGAPPSARYLSTFTVMTNNLGTITTTPVISVNPGSPCSINGSTVTMTGGTGTCSPTATWAPDSNYSGTSATQNTMASEIQPTVTFTGAPSSAAYQSTFVVATSNGNTITTIPVISASGGCTVSGSTVTMTSGSQICNLTATWASDGNYSGTSKTQRTSGTRIAPTVTFTGAPQSAAYGSTFTVSASTNASTTPLFGFGAGSNACKISGTTVTMTSGTGTCILSANWSADQNYTSASRTQTAAAVKVSLTVTANNAAITFGQAIPTLTAGYNGFVNNENPSVLSGSPSLMTIGTSYSQPGVYPITVALGTLASSNYSFVGFNSGTLTINPTGTVPPSGTACNGAYQGGTFNGNITVAANQICEIDQGTVKGGLVSTGGIVILIGSTVTGDVQIHGTATGAGAALTNQVCGSEIQGTLFFLSDSDALSVGGTSCGTTKVDRNLQVQFDTGSVSIAATSVGGSVLATNDTNTVLLSGNTVGLTLSVLSNTDKAVNATQVLNNKVAITLLCTGNASITGSGNTAKAKLGQCAAF